MKLFWILLLAVAVPLRAEFAFQDGDTVVFLGDSITAARRYDRIIENYTLLRYPQRHVKFFNAGKGGDTMTGALDRLQREVFDRHATVLTVAFGVNDIGWGMKADEEHKAAYLRSLRTLIERCQEKQVRVFLCSPAITNEDPDRSERGFLQQMCDEGLALAKSLGAETVDILRSMRKVQRHVLVVNKTQKDPARHTKLHVEDGVHLNELGQLAMAVALLKGLGAPAEVSSAEIDAASARPLAASGCTITNVKATADSVVFDRLDEGLPLNFGTFGALNFMFIPVPQELNRYMLTVRGLAAGKYDLRAGGRALGKFTNKQLAAGLNISSMTANGWEPGGPWDAQAAALKMVTDARMEILGSQSYSENFLSNHPGVEAVRQETQATLESLEALQRKYASPATVHFEVKRTGDE
ncbi:SGNH/GDSL hydrolase family protein [Prosthecobacter sp.]|uniref:SGNH/GDSL hydrolase family protein n=1 Tax=Prosthecobacter sp. TaxID=1965333 RepID=UPI002ABB3DCD|nr:SGNH/GDSL hydrolase family protein [Prosthecobacter sp.]MDZ4405411.1 SGNH/GDSL hydrolase family protein [Prosthecobacter sp.]